MYSDPSLIRKHFVKLSLSDHEAALIEALCNYTGEQKATLIRDMVLRKAAEVLHGGNSGAPTGERRGTNNGLSVA